MKKIFFVLYIAVVSVIMSVCIYAADSDSALTGGENTRFNKKLADYLAEVNFSNTDNIKIADKLASDGFDTIKTYYYYSDEKDGTSFAIAKKYVGSKPVILVAIRRTNDNEWYGNFNIADSGENCYHESFRKAADMVLTALKEYAVKECDFNNVMPRLVITGYSRGAAVANITAALLNDFCDDICAYTYAAPAVTTLTDTGDEKYNYIHNIINPEDFVTVAPLEEWGYHRYGRDYILPSALNNANYYDMLPYVKQAFKDYTNNSYDPFEDDSTNNFKAQVLKLAPTLDDYYNKQYMVSGYGYMTMRQYLDKAAVLLCDSSSYDEKMEVYDMMRMMDGTYYQFITRYLYDNYMNGKLLNSHDIYTYASWMTVLDDDFFTAQCTPERLRGDVTCDGILSADDGAFILQKVIDNNFNLPVETETDDFLSVADVDGDDRLTASDAAYVLQKVIDDSFEFASK